MFSTPPASPDRRSLLRTFLGAERIRALSQVLIAANAAPLTPILNLKAVIAALLLSVAPGLMVYLNSLMPDQEVPLAFLATGVCAVLAVVARARMGLRHQRISNWKRSLSFAHTGFALGCIPAVVIVMLQPHLFAERQDLVGHAVTWSQEARTWHSVLSSIAAIIGIAIWASVTEEYIFRGLLVAALRRSRLLIKHRYRDPIAVVISASIFGAAHFPTWGPFAAVALVGIGIGFGFAYIANNEEIVPNILYHFAFDTLSIALAAYLHIAR